MNIDKKIFKDYDIRGTYPNQINGEIASQIAYAIVRKFQPKLVVIGRDARVSGPELLDSFIKTFTKLGIDVYDQGVVGTEFMSFVAGTYQYDLVLMISASHNPPEYNGIKMTRKGSISVSSSTGLSDIRDLTDLGPLPDAKKPGSSLKLDVSKEWREKILSLVDIKALKPFTVVADAGNGVAGKLVPLIFAGLPMKLIPLYFELDGNFPNHVPNPLIEKNNNDLIAKIKEIKADVGITFDGDADRMFLIDDKGRFVSGTITSALLSRYLLEKNPGAMLLYNAICGRIVPKTITQYGGKCKRVRVGYSFIKAEMRATNAVFAGEHSGHYFYKDFFNAESGVLSALMVLSLLSEENKKLSELVDELSIYPASGEINFVVTDIPKIESAIKEKFKDAKSIDELDGVSVWYQDYWFNVRASKTEPVMRLNLEADNDEILKTKTAEVITFIESLGGKRKE